MALIHVFDGLNHETTYTFSGKLSEHITDVDWAHSIILRGGYRIENDYEVQPDDIIYIRRTPSGFENYTPLDWVLTIITAGLYIPFKFGYDLYQKQKELNRILEDNQKKQKSSSEQVDKLPFIKGAQNRAATGRSFP